jgi:hypothetical protein
LIDPVAEILSLPIDRWATLCQVWAARRSFFFNLDPEVFLKTLTIPKRTLLIALGLAVVLALGIAAIRALPIPNGDSPLSPDDVEASAAATRALEAFYQIDTREGQEAWLGRVCALTTPSGCQFLRLGAGPLWEQLAAAQVKATATVTPEEKLSDTESEQIWRMRITLSQPLPGSDLTEDSAYVLIVKTDAGWLFERFLMAKEIEALQSEASN